MSRGAGRVERAIRVALEREPENAFKVEELCRRIYAQQPEKKHRVAVSRAIRTLLNRAPEVACESAYTRGNPLVIYSR